MNMAAKQGRLEVIDGLLAMSEHRGALWEAVSQSTDPADLVHRLKALGCSDSAAQIAASSPLSAWTISRIDDLRSERD